MSIALYRKYRSKSLDEIVGQSHVTDVLRRALTANKIAHAYLLTGPRGTGKTSIARILAHEINNLEYTDESEHLDIIEIDAASNNGIDDVRELREKAIITPTVAKKKVYIIDEVHMLSKPAFNALLKILEEPPEHVVFILATTDFDKLPDTIVSRTQRYHFHTIATSVVAAHLRTIADAEKISISDNALLLIAERGGGSLRDSISLLDQLQHAAGGNVAIDRESAETALGLATANECQQLVAALQSGDAQKIIAYTDEIAQRGVSAATLASQLVQAVTAKLAVTPSLVHLLEGLMEVPKSSHPDTKLLVTLLSGVVEKPKTVAQVVHAPVVTAATKPVPAVQKHTTSQSSTRTPEAPDTQPPTPAVSDDIDMGKFDWQAILEYTREHHTALYAILSKCMPEVRGETLVLYAGRKFNKTKLESPKNRPILGQILAETGVGTGVNIDILETTAPPKDSKAAEIAAMMGGGEEVDVE